MIIDEQKISDEILNLLRSSDIFSITQRGVTTVTEDFVVGTTGEATLDLEAKLKNIRSVKYGTTYLVYGRDYLPNFETSKLVIHDAVVNTYTVVYDKGDSDKIFSDYPRADLGIEGYPRIAFGIYSIATDAGGFGNVNVSDINLQINVYDFTVRAVRELMTAVRTLIIENQTNVYYLSYIKPGAQRQETVIKERAKGRILMKSMDFYSRFNYEIN
jgi:hypothetical protein